MAQLGRDAVELVATDNQHLERGNVGETLREVQQIVLMEEQGDQLLQPVNTHNFIPFKMAAVCSLPPTVKN